MRNARHSAWIACLWLIGLAVTQPAKSAVYTTDDSAVETVLQLADRRLAVMPAVAAAKWQSHAPVFDAPREAAVIQRAQDLAAPMGLAAAPIGRLFALQARLARGVQGALQEKWRNGGFSYPTPVPTLARLRPRLDSLTVRLLQALYIAAPVVQQGGFAARYAALARQQLHEPGWSEQNRRELLAALEAIRQTPTPVLQRIKASGILLVGTTGDYAPFSMEAGGVLSGSDVDLAQDLATHLQARAVFVHTTWLSLLGDLQHGRFDVAIGGVSVTPARATQGAFSVGYAAGGKTILARCADARQYPDLAAVDQPQVRVIVNAGGTNEAYVHASLHRARILVQPDNRTIFDALGRGLADVMITDDIEAELQIRHHPGLCRTYRGTLTHSEKAILMPRDTDLIEAVNGWMRAALAAGEPARLLGSYLDR